MAEIDIEAAREQINAARAQTYDNIALTQAQLTLATQAADAAARDRAAIQAIAQQTVRVDTTVGTRVFAGDVMIHGDTGIRNVNTWGRNGVTVDAQVRRIGSLVSLQLTVTFPVGIPTGSTIAELPVGFMTYGHSAMPYGYATGYPAMAVTRETVKYWGVVPSSVVTQHWRWVYDTKDPWPASLPGTPA